MLTPSGWSMLTRDTEMTIRRARPEDARKVRDLAQLDSVRPLGGDVLLAEAGGHPLAALEVASGRAAADPFVPSAPAVSLLRILARPAAR